MSYLRITTKFFGEIDISEKCLIHFDKGLPGFPEEKQFVLLSHGEGSPFVILQSTGNLEVAFILISPFTVMPHYEIQITDSVKQELKIQETEDVQVWSIVVLREPISESTVNLKAPVILNTKMNKAQQVILEKGDYSTRHPLVILQSNAEQGAGE
ncbi:flagellar assembly protein FliW [Effusibacillus lacus]|uniref:flagellar assembly protein FliW n=1 Tax=Effusibacillus lacus TaxID=1348429 RepID=UPI0022B17719|nr:flagellar assembly protein FliW [Effusibacillus lacus]